MRKFFMLPVLLVAPALQAATLDVTINPEDCEELIEASEMAKTALQAAGLEASNQVEAGGELQEEACLDDLREVDFDFFGSIPSIQGAMLSQLKDQAIEQITTMACDAANEVIGAANTMLTCNASAGVSLDASAGFDSLDSEECLGAGGDALEYNYDAGTYEAGSGGQYGGSVDGEAGGTTRGEGEGGDDAGSGSGWGDWIGDDVSDFF